MSDTLRIELTPEESSDCLGTIAISFAVHNGRVIITEHWGEMGESWSDGVHVTIPARVWKEGLAWIANQSRMT